MDYSGFAFPKGGKKIKSKETLEKAPRKQCLLCGNKKGRISSHHVIPRSYRRLDIDENLVPLCEFGKDDKPGCHVLVEGKDFDKITFRIMQHFDKDRIDGLRQLSPDWSFWLYYDEQVPKEEL